MAKDDNHHSTVCVSQNSHGHFVAEENSYMHSATLVQDNVKLAPCLLLDGACRQRTMSDCAWLALILAPSVTHSHNVHMNTVEAQLKDWRDVLYRRSLTVENP